MSTVYPYLGTPDAMQQLVGPSGGMTREPIGAPSAVPNLAGGESTVHPLQTRDRFTLPYTSRPGTGFADLLMMFRDRVFGVGPFVFVDPSVSNVLGLDTSTTGIVDGAHGWVGSGGTVTVDATQVTPQAGSAVLKWASPGASKTLQPGTVAGTADITTAAVILPAENTTGSLWCKASGSGAQYRLDYFDVTGAYISSSGTTAVSTSWVRYSRNLLAGLAPAGAVFVLPTVFTTGTPANVWIAAGQIEYGVTTPSPWQRGYRSPRVTITGYPAWAADKYDGYASHTLVLSEAY